MAIARYSGFAVIIQCSTYFQNAERIDEGVIVRLSADLNDVLTGRTNIHGAEVVIRSFVHPSPVDVVRTVIERCPADCIRHKRTRIERQRGVCISRITELRGPLVDERATGTQGRGAVEPRPSFVIQHRAGDERKRGVRPDREQTVGFDLEAAFEIDFALGVDYSA